MRVQRNTFRGTLLLLASLVACSDDPTGPGDPNDDDPPCDPDNGGLTLPSGFCAVVVAKDLGRARHVAVRSNGDIYVAIDNSQGASDGGVIALRDTDDDGKADQQQKFGPTGGTSVAIHNGQLFFAPNDRVLRYTFSGDELVPTGGEATVVSGLPADGDHPRKAIAFDDDGNLFVNIASASNSCQEENREDGSPGVDPCPELDTRAGVWRFDADATGQSLANGTRFGAEMRNMTALTVNSADGMLYGVQHGRDQLFDNWGDLFTAQDDALLPAEELFRIESGKSYGWPYCYFDGAQNKKVLAPEYGGDGEAEGRCTDREDPIATYPAHWAPLGMVFYHDDMFPALYQGGLFIAWHGSRFDTSLQPAGPGYNVTFTRWQGGNPAGPYLIFANGFAGGTATPSGAAHRPVGLTVGPDGSLYITDDKAGWVWRVFYKN
jgi:glucose/arabinose dehydrogenase